MQQKKRPPEGGRGDVVTKGIGTAFVDPNTAADQAQSEVRLQHLARRIHRLGERAVFELLHAQLTRGGDLLARCEAFAAIAPAALVIAGGDHFPPLLVSVDGGRR